MMAIEDAAHADEDLLSVSLSDVGDVVLAAEDLHQLRFVVADVALHEVHAGTEQPLECVHIQNWGVGEKTVAISNVRNARIVGIF